MSVPQAILPQVPPAPLDPTQSLFHGLRSCLTLQDPAERNAQARIELNADNNSFIANSGRSDLIGLACEVAMNLTDGQERADVAEQLLIPPARSVMAGSADVRDLVSAVDMAHCLLTEEARTEAVAGLLSTQAACERLSNMVYGIATTRPGEPRDRLLRQYLTPHVCRAIGKSNSFLAIGETGYAISQLPPQERGAAAVTLLPHGAAAVGMSGNVRSIMQTLEAVSSLPPHALEASLGPLLIPKACAALAMRAPPEGISKAAYAAATLLQPGALRDAVLQDLLIPPAYEAVANMGRDDERVDAAYAATFMPRGGARDSALMSLVTDDTVEQVGDYGLARHQARLSFAAAHLADETVRHARLLSLVSRACTNVVEEGTDQDVRLMWHAANLLPACYEKDEALQVLNPRMAALAPLDWRDIAVRPQMAPPRPAAADRARDAGPPGP